ncbi:putative uncharacterized protein [Prevotella sp. CAG:1124]|nr:putative uncharacterized protein [Prevotella sp. CAG:1124]
MRIGILTLPLHTNYGGILQAYALQTVLERMGHDVCLIEKKRQPLRLPLWKAPLSYGKRIIKNLTGHPYPICFEQKINREEPLVRQNTDKFVNKYIKRRFVDDFSEIGKDDFDAIVIGSDQVWRPKYFIDGIENAYLTFAKEWNIRRIAYAASFGTDKWEYSSEQTTSCRRLLKNFDAVSVRESSAVTLCREHLGVDVKRVLDPTMLLSTNDYMKLFDANGTPKSNGNLLCYIIDETPEKMSFVNKIAQERGLIPFRVNSKVENLIAPLQERIQPPVEQWLRGFYDADFVVTDSFHACVFSILFNKPFFVLGNEKRGLSRFSSLLGMFGMENLLVTNKDLNEKQNDIDWARVMSLLAEEKKKAINFLNENLQLNNERL